MSTAYYLRSKKKHHDYSLLKTKWQDEIFGKLLSDINALCNKNRIDNELKYELTECIEEKLQHFPLSDYYYEERIGVSTAKGFHFDGAMVQNIAINSYEDIENFLEKNPDYILIDENETEVNPVQLRKYPVL